jgi:hypothetical protein
MKAFAATIITILTGLFFLTGCKSPVYVERNESASLAKPSTYMWVQTTENQEIDTRNVSGLADESVHSAVKAELDKRGWREVKENPDVLLSYDILVERSRRRQSDPVYTVPMSRVYFNPYTRRWGTVYYPSQFIGYETYSVPTKEGTVTITMIDADTDKTIFQAYTSDEIKTGKFTSDDIRKQVKNIFRKF